MSISVSRELNEIALQTAKDLRQEMTTAEKVLWEKMRNRKEKGLKIKRQVPVFYESEGMTSFFIADFMIMSAKLIIEADGPIHKRQQKEDEKRDAILQSLGYSVIRLSNDDILNDTENTIKRIVYKARNCE